MMASRTSPELRTVSAHSRCSGVEIRVEQETGHPDHRVHGRADLVAHRGEEVALGAVRRLGLLLRLAQGLLGALAGGHVLLDGDEVTDRAVVALDAVDGHLLGVEGPVLAPVRHLAGPRPAVADRPPEGGVERLVVYAGLEKARILADRFLRRVAGEPRERPVHPGDGAAGVRDHDAVRRRVERASLQAKLQLGFPLRRDVAADPLHPDQLTGRVEHRNDADVGPVARPVLAYPAHQDALCRVVQALQRRVVLDQLVAGHQLPEQVGVGVELLGFISGRRLARGAHVVDAPRRGQPVRENHVASILREEAKAALARAQRSIGPLQGDRLARPQDHRPPQEHLQNTEGKIDGPVIGMPVQLENQNAGREGDDHQRRVGQPVADHPADLLPASAGRVAAALPCAVCVLPVHGVAVVSSGRRWPVSVYR